MVGRPSADGPAKGPTTKEAMALVSKTSGVSFGCVCIPERHTDEYAQRRGKAAPGEHLNMLRKQQAGAEWFVSQAVWAVWKSTSGFITGTTSRRWRGAPEI